MIKKFFARDSVLKIISFLAAILVWLYVIYLEDPKIEITVDDVPVVCRDAELADGLMLISCDVNEVDAKVSASRSDMIEFDESEIEAYVDLSRISGAGKFDDVRINVRSNNKNVEVKEFSQKLCSVVTDEIVSEKFSVETELYGDLPEGRVITSEPILFAKSVTVTGAKTYVNKIKRAFVRIDRNRADESKTVSTEILLEDKDGSLIDEEHIAYKFVKLSETNASAYVSVGKTKKVDVEVRGAENNKKYSVSPSKVEIYSKNGNIEKIYTESIENKKINDGESITLKLDIPDDVIFAGDKAEVSVKAKNN